MSGMSLQAFVLFLTESVRVGPALTEWGATALPGVVLRGVDSWVTFGASM